MDLREIVWEDVNRIDLAQDVNKLRAAVNAIMNHRVPKIARDFLKLLAFQRMYLLHRVSQTLLALCWLNSMLIEFWACS